MMKRKSLSLLLVLSALLAIPTQSWGVGEGFPYSDTLRGGDKKSMQAFAAGTNLAMGGTLVATAVGALGYSIGNITSLCRDHIWPAICGKDPKPALWLSKVSEGPGWCWSCMGIFLCRTL